MGFRDKEQAEEAARIATCQRHPVVITQAKIRHTKFLEKFYKYRSIYISNLIQWTPDFSERL